MSFFVPLKPYQPYGLSPYAFWEDFLTDAEIDKILGHPNWMYTKQAKVGMTVEEARIDKERRSSECSWLPHDKSTEAIWNKLTTVITQVNRQYFQFNLTGCYEPAQLTSYKSTDEGHYSCHVDSSESSEFVPRKLSMSLLLSDPSEYEGGNLEVFYDQLDPTVLEQKRGRAWFFPSYMRHRVTKVTKGMRRSLVLWVGGPNFK